MRCGDEHISTISCPRLRIESVYDYYVSVASRMLFVSHLMYIARFSIIMDSVKDNIIRLLEIRLLSASMSLNLRKV